MEQKPTKDIEVDAEYEKIKKLTPGLGDDEPKAPEPEKVEEKKEEVIEPKEENKPKEEDKKPLPDDEDDGKKADDKKPDDGDKSKEKKPRPEKYIPIDEYTGEKRKWKETLEQKDARIAELEKIASTTAPDSKIADDKVQKYAEKHGIDPDEARVELERIRDGFELLNDKPAAEEKKAAEFTDEQRQTLADAERIKAEKLFNAEYDLKAIPEIKNYFKDATPEQIERAKAFVEQVSCTKDFLDKPLDYVIYKTRGDLEQFFKKEVAGPESSRPSQKESVGDIKASDFSTGKLNFSELDKLSDAERNKLIEEFDMPTYEKYSKYNERNAAIVINRGGKKVGF